jgi:hypothetical protein
MNAPVCPVSKNQLPTGGPRNFPTTLIPAIPVATDLPSLIRAVNIMRDILRTITTSLTVNNVWEQQYGNTYLMSPYPDWSQSQITTKQGYVYYKAKGKEPDPEQRVYAQRIDAVEFHNGQRAADPTFFWRLKKDFDSETGDSKGVKIFEEDFFERIVNVKWGAGLAVEFGDGAKAPPKADQPATAEAEPVA